MIGQAERLYQLKELGKKNNTKILKKNIVAISSGKGGTGKTFFTLNLGYSLSKLFKRVLIVDLDRNLSNINIMLNVAVERSVINYYREENNLKELVYNYDKNLDFIFGDSGRLDYPKMTRPKLEAFWEELIDIASDYDVVLLDIASGANEEILFYLTKASINILLTSPEPTAVMDAYVVLKLLSVENYRGEKLIVVNKSQNLAEGQQAFLNLSKAAERFLNEKIKFLGVVTFNEKVSESIMRQELFCKIEPNSKTSFEIKNIANQLTKVMQMANNNQ